MSAIFTIALLSATSSVADADSMRMAYNNCLVDFTIEQLDAKTKRSVFAKSAREACASQRDAMAAAIKKDELEFGSTEQEATDYANEETENVVFAFIDGYADYMSSNTRPVREE
ncbi:hypothetical protein SAMN02745824_2484 [Parasphingorhabdus marina DSM 22363]|uniref:UrcA family protein n=1 Tax=Parasphingorhabdus marina DSM 22363 TaxID=1123272 RepID=A0A1N6FPH6_9SPHN|nr:hypothetical protein [Parasphingorhabdus marina]SIN97148.1 hypothetical protein SAMN02745824_2484 [Parasphingorhabdus marina DSM 22363]